MKTESRIYYTYESREDKPWKIILISISITLFVYTGIPLMDKLFKQKPKLQIRELDTLKLSEEPPTKNIPPKKRPPQEKPKEPKLSVPQKAYEPLPINVSLNLAMTPIENGFSLNFNMKPDISVETLVFEIEEVDTPPTAIVQIPPLYPIKAKAMGIEGQVNLLFIVTETGEVEQIKIDNAENGEYFIESAIQAVKKWRFKPGTKNGKEVPVRVSLPLNFKIGN